ncbi:transposase domain-containing protein, partial [Novosphingobium pentaromativorans]|uniref:transposase domain-containing protein n=1 Tax=Novosphingobium pentaromativorans TaxID=205844 RepID=UPI00110FB9BF
LCIPFHNRKNALFAGHELGAENWAAIASLVETCKLGRINPNAYLADVLARIVLRGDGDPLDDLLPGNWDDTNAAAPAFETNSVAQAA